MSRDRRLKLSTRLVFSRLTDQALHSYVLKKITTFLESEGFEYKPTRYQSDGIYFTGCQVIFPTSDVVMSVQTNPATAGTHFAETAILNNEGILHIPSLGYEYVISHNELENLVTHLREIKISLEGRNTVDFPDATIRRISGVSSRPSPPRPPMSQPNPVDVLPSSDLPPISMDEFMSLMMLIGGPQSVDLPDAAILGTLCQLLGISPDGEISPNTEAPPT